MMADASSWHGLLAFGPQGWGDELLRGAWLTLQLAVASMALGLVLGLLLAGARLSRHALLRWPAAAWTLFVRGVPEFLILLFVFFGSESLINAVLAGLGVDSRVTVPRFGAAVAGLAIIFAAYASEVFRGAYLAIPRGQIEAAEAIGFSRTQVFIRIRLPQLWRIAIPGLGNLWMVVLKDTSLAAVIALDELLRVAKIAGETTRMPLLFFVAAGLIYLVFTAVSDVVRGRLEARASRGMVR